MVKYLVKKVTQFPSDTECYNYIRSIQDKDPELKIRCAQCVETIIAAKDRQEKEANKNAEQLLRQIEEEKRKETERKQKRKTTKDKRKQNVSFVGIMFLLKLFFLEKRTKGTRADTVGTAADADANATTADEDNAQEGTGVA